MEAKIEKQNAVDKIKNEKYREENQNRYQYKEKTKMYHDLSDDYKSRDYVIAITLKKAIIMEIYSIIQLLEDMACLWT